jgi:uncharacterized protein (TIGR00251 family)
MLELSESGGAVLLPVKVVPGASRTKYMGEWQGRARFSVAAPPEKGKANEALVKALAKLLGVDRRRVSVVVGTTSPLKTVRIEGVACEAVRAALTGE